MKCKKCGSENISIMASTTEKAKMLTPKEVRMAQLTVHRFREGYDTDEVDDLLDACADTIETLSKVLESIVKAKGENK